jgi:DNA repair exonuclease SbcCD ATPase subunit
MTLLQKELTAAIAKRDSATATLEALREQRKNAQAAISAAEQSENDAREQLKSATDAASIAKAKKAFTTAATESEAAKILFEGAREREVAAESALADCEKHVSRVAARVATLAGRDVEERALELARELGRLVTRRRQLARFAGVHATRATGTASDPLGGQYHYEATPFSRAIAEAMSPASEPVMLEEMLTIVLSEPEAQAAE